MDNKRELIKLIDGLSKFEIEGYIKIRYSLYELVKHEVELNFTEEDVDEEIVFLEKNIINKY